MSSFFVQGNVSSDQEQQDNRATKGGATGPSYSIGFQGMGTSGRRAAVQSQKDKKWALFRGMVNKINAGINNNDFGKVWDILQELLKDIDKSTKLIEKEGYPGFFLKALLKIKEVVEDQELRTKMKKNNNFNSLRNKFLKLLPKYEEGLSKYVPEEDIEEVASSSSSSEDSEESEEDDFENWELIDHPDINVRRKFWLKKAKKEDEKKEEKTKEQELEERERRRKENEKNAAVGPKFNIKESTKKKVEIASVKEAEARLRLIIKDFGKLNSQEKRLQYIENLNQIKKRSESYAQFEKLSFLLVDIPIRIEVARQMRLTHFNHKDWLVIFEHIKKIHELIHDPQDDDLFDNVIQFNETEDQKVKSSQESIYLIIKSFMVIMENELKKAFMFMENSDEEYASRLQDLIKLIDLMYEVSKQLSFKDELMKDAAELSYKVLMSMHFMSKDFFEKLRQGSETTLSFLELENEDTLKAYAEKIFEHCSKEDITRTILFMVFNQAVNQNKNAKEMLIVSNVPQIIQSMDYYTQALYNRALAALGLNAFHHKNLYDVQHFLSEMCSYGKNKEQTREIIREYLAQGYIRGKIEKEVPKNKIMPYYMHLNIELIESVELISSMLLEIPYMVKEGGKISSRPFKKVYYEYERSHFIAEPLNNRDLIYAACCELKKGKWEACYDRLMELTIWSEMNQSEITKQNLLSVIKKQSLKCYLIGNKKCFHTVSLKGLSQRFQIDEEGTKRLICRWIYNRVIEGAINNSGYLEFSQKKESQMEKICENLFAKLKELRENSEQMFEQRLNVVAEDDEDNDKDNRLTRRSNLAMIDKLKAILLRRA